MGRKHINPDSRLWLLLNFSQKVKKCFDVIVIESFPQDTLTVTNPNGIVPPTICGYNTGQHMWVPASDQCNEINIGKHKKL